MKALILAFSIIAAALIVSTAAAAVAPDEAGRDWIAAFIELSPALAIVLAAWWGFNGVRETQIANAELARETQIANAKLAREQAMEAQNRESRRRQAEARTLARSLSAELHAAAIELLSNLGIIEMNKNAAGKAVHDASSARIIGAPPVAIFQAQLHNIGLLGELAEEVVTVYNMLHRIIRFDDDLRKIMEADKAAELAFEFDPGKRWGAPAAAVTKLANKLASYAATDDI